MRCVRDILSFLLILVLLLGTTTQAVQRGMIAGLPSMAAAALDHSDMPGCEGCVSGQDTNKGMEMASCHSGTCIVLPGLLPNTPVNLAVVPETFAWLRATVADGLSPPPDHRPPISVSLV
jgi:hypothetical protein